MKKILLAASVLVMLGGCATKANDSQKENIQQDEAIGQTYPVTTYMNDAMKEVEEAGPSMMVSILYKSPSEWAKEADHIVLATIISLDKAVTIMPDGSKNLFGETFGKMLIQNTYSGTSLDGEVVSFAKPGGVVSMQQYDDASEPEAVEKRQRLREESDNDMDLSTTYVNLTTDADITFEEGKTYILAIDYVEEYACYNVIGLEVMSRETDIPAMNDVRQLRNLPEIKVKNNEVDDETYETLDDVLKAMDLT